MLWAQEVVGNELTRSLDVAAKAAETDVYCSLFDLTTVRALRSGDQARLHLVDVDELASSSKLPADLYEVLYQRLASIISEGGYSCVPC